MFARGRRRAARKRPPAPRTPVAAGMGRGEAGAAVARRKEWDIFDRDILTALIHAADSAGALGEYLESRRILEIEAAGLAAERATAEDLTDLSDAFARMTDSAEQARTNPAAER